MIVWPFSEEIFRTRSLAMRIVLYDQLPSRDSSSVAGSAGRTQRPACKPLSLPGSSGSAEVN